MKKNELIIMSALTALAVSSCFSKPEESGFIGENIYLQGGDTLYVAIGAAKSTEKAWLDNSTKPVTFKIENVRDEEGNRNEDFFTEIPTRMWNTPYDHLTDTTYEQVIDKLADVEITPLMINEVNGQLRVMETTGQMESIQPGDVYHVDVSATNSKGTRYIEDYAIIKFESGVTASDFVCQELINGIAVLGQDNYVFFPYYEQVNDTKSNWASLQEKIYKGEEVHGMTLKKISAEPVVGVKLVLKFLDKNGNLFNPAGYASYTTNNSFITHGVNRQNTEDGMVVEFPYTPWPVVSDATFLSYMRGPHYSDLSNVDIAALSKDFPSLVASNSYASWPSADTYPELQSVFYNGDKAIWPTGWFEENAAGWYVRLRSRTKFHQPGTYELTVKVPYTTAK